MPLVETRYAEALVELAFDKNLIEQLREELFQVSEVFERCLELRFLLLNMKIGADIKKETIKQVFKDNIKPETLNFLMLLIDKNRIRYLPGIVREFNRLADKKQNILNIKIYSAFPLDEMQVERLKEKYRRIYKAASVKAEIEIDKSLIGGVKVKIGDKVIDASVTGKVNTLKELLLSAGDMNLKA